MSPEYITDRVSRSHKFPTSDYTHLEAIEATTCHLRNDYDVQHVEKVDVSRDGMGENWHVSVTALIDEEVSEL